MSREEAPKEWTAFLGHHALVFVTLRSKSRVEALRTVQDIDLIGSFCPVCHGSGITSTDSRMSVSSLTSTEALGLLNENAKQAKESLDTFRKTILDKITSDRQPTSSSIS
jgi:hypothetical protein